MTSRTGPPRLDKLVGIPVRRLVRSPAADLEGVSVAGEPLRIPVTGVEGYSLVLFLSTHCDGCAPLWEAWTRPTLLEAQGMPPVARVVAIVPEERRGRHERPDVLASWCAQASEGGRWPGSARLVRSDTAWSFYKVLGPPFFALVDGPGGVIATEGVTWAIEQLAGDVARALGSGG